MYARGSFVKQIKVPGIDPYWGTKGDYYQNGLKHGFDLSTFKSEKAYNNFLKKNGFRIVDQAPEGDRDQVTVWMNPLGVIMITEHSGFQPHRKGFVGYVGFEASKYSKNSLNKVVESFKRHANYKAESPGSRDYI